MVSDCSGVAEFPRRVQFSDITGKSKTSRKLVE